MRRSLLPALDAGILALAFLGAVYLRFNQDLSRVAAYRQLVPGLVTGILVVLLCLYYGGLYDDPRLQGPFDTTRRFFRSFAAALLSLLTLYYFLPWLRVGRGVLALFLTFALVGLLSARALYVWLGQEEKLAARLLVIGTGSTAQKITREILLRRPWGLRVAGILSDNPADVGRLVAGAMVIGTVDELPQVVRHLRARVVVVALDDRRDRLPIELLLHCRIQGVTVEEGASVLERLTGRIPTSNLRPSVLVFAPGFSDSPLVRRLKYAAELLAACMLLMALLPLIVLVGVAVRMSGRGPVIYTQERVGWRGRHFRLLKFRTMRLDAEAATGPVWSSGEDDPRVTRLGRLLRKTRFDELPQLVNVIRGEMSFVGPRPERPHFVDALRRVIPLFDERHSVRPGITGWAQIKCGYGSSIEDAEQKLQFDLYYIKHMSLALDVAILLDTLKVVAVGRGAR